MVHQYKNNGYNIVLDVNSGSVHVVDDLVYDIIALYEQNSLEEIVAKLSDKYAETDLREAYGEIEELVQAECLFTKDIYRDYIFDYKNYVFYIEKTDGRFPLTDLSDGYSSALDIVADIILKMQDGVNVVRTYDVPGMVFIDEIETHLHLKLQREILPLLTSIFPKIQFVVTTHSPFVLSSVENAVVYDLKNQETITDLSDYSYEIITEGYFGVKTESDKLRRNIDRLKGLLEKKSRTSIEEDDKNRLVKSFDSLPDMVAPEIKAQYHELMIRYAN